MVERDSGYTTEQWNSQCCSRGVQVVWYGVVCTFGVLVVVTVFEDHILGAINTLQAARGEVHMSRHPQSDNVLLLLLLFVP